MARLDNLIYLGRGISDFTAAGGIFSCNEIHIFFLVYFPVIFNRKYLEERKKKTGNF